MSSSWTATVISKTGGVIGTKSAFSSLRLNLSQQFALGFFQVVKKLGSVIQDVGVMLELLSQLFCGRVVKEGDVLIEIRPDQRVAKFLIVRHAIKTPTNRGFQILNCGDCLDIEHFITARLKYAGHIGRAVIGVKGKRLKRWHFARRQFLTERRRF